MLILRTNFGAPEHGYHLDSDRKVHTNKRWIAATQKRHLDRGRIHFASEIPDADSVSERNI